MLYNDRNYFSEGTDIINPLMTGGNKKVTHT